MSFRIVYTRRAARELEDAADWWAENRDSDQAVRWYNGITGQIQSLAGDPERFPLALENDDFPYTIRELYFGLSSQPTHRIVFTITDENVVVVAIRHFAQDRLTADDVSI